MDGKPVDDPAGDPRDENGEEDRRYAEGAQDHVLSCGFGRNPHLRHC
jgi:hypothetical protein